MKTHKLRILAVVLVTLLTVASAVASSIEGYAERIYNEYATATDGKIAFTVETQETAK